RIARLPMIASRRNAVPAVALLVYLSSILGGGLHHHDHGEAFANEDSGRLAGQLAERTIQSGLPKASTHEDADGCTLCTALHQAKALPIAISPANGIIPVAETSVLPVESPIAPFCTIQQARAPPLMS